MNDTQNTTFSDFDLAAPLLAELAKRGFSEPTPVQRGVLGLHNRDRDLVVQARTGSGKTLAFLLPLMTDLAEQAQGAVQALILSPTRELAQQIAGESESFGHRLGLKTATLVGGMDMDRQIAALRGGASIVVGTPGRVLDHLRRGSLKLDELSTVVLDEGDTMLDMGFRDDLEAILDAAHTRRRTWLFSATVPDGVFALCRRFLDDPLHMTLDAEDAQHADIVHRAYLVPSRQKYEGLVNILLWERPTLCLIFCRTRSDTAELTERLQEEGFLAMPLHGDMSQRERNTALASFRSGRIPILVATNVAARGLDVEGVSHVIQLGLPESMETFVHRSGRTGRAGNEGVNLLVLTPAESSHFKYMLRGTPMRVEWLKVPDQAEIAVTQKAAREDRLIAQEPSTEMVEWARELLAGDDDPTRLVAQLLSQAVRDLPRGYPLRQTLVDELERRASRANEHRTSRVGSYDRNAQPRRGGNKAGDERYGGHGVSIRIAKGRRDDDWSVGRILGALCGTLGVDRTEIGNIRMREHHTEVELSPKAISQLENGGRGRLQDRGLMDRGDGEAGFRPKLGGAFRPRRFDNGERRPLGDDSVGDEHENRRRSYRNRENGRSYRPE